MKLKKNRKFLVATAIILALVIGASATFAWVTSRDQLANEFKNEGFGSASNGMTIIENQEDFDFEIGVAQDKEVSVLNTTGSPMLARVSFEEMIKLLDSDNAYADYEYTTSSTAASDDYEAVPFNESDVSGWTTVNWAGAPAGITVKTPNPGAASPLCAVIYTAGGKTWVAKFASKPEYDPDTTSITNEPTVQYAYYKKGTAYYNTWNDQHNYLPWASATPWGTVTPAAASIVSKVGTSALAPSGSAYAAAVAAEAAKIEFIYDALNASAVEDSDTWFYNENDGYFYYMSVIPGGGSSEMLLKQVKLSSAATTKMWEKYEYTLVVCVEGIQATKEALSDTEDLGDASGWGLDGTLLAKLEAAIDAYNA